MKKGKIIVFVLLALSLMAFIASFTTHRSPSDMPGIASKMSSQVDKKLSRLDDFAKQALEQERYEWLEMKDLPEDMVIYRYVFDTLQSWKNQFPLKNDNISSKAVVQVLSNPRVNLSSPLLDVKETPQLFNFGPSWYIVKCVNSEDGIAKIICGLRVDGNVAPLSSTEGYPVNVAGTPMFKLIGENQNAPSPLNISFVLAALAFLIAAGFAFLLTKRTLRNFFISSCGMLCGITAVYMWGRTASGAYELFSPMLYADRGLLYSLGALLLADVAIICICLSLYMVRKDLVHKVQSKPATALAICGIFLAIVAIACYVHLTLCSILRNSNVCLELYKLYQMTGYSILVLFFSTGVLLCIPVLLQLSRPAVFVITGLYFDTFSRIGRVVTASLIAVYMVTVPTILGFQKEKNRISVLSDRLAVERDIALELNLKGAEDGIATDMFISALTVLDGMESTIYNRVTDLYLPRIPQEYTSYVMVFNDSSDSKIASQRISERLNGTNPVFEGSRFMYRTTLSGMVEYTGVFQYFNERYGVSTVLLCLDSRQISVDKGYASLMDMVSPGKVTIPALYSYAKYKFGDLQVFRGDFPYSTSLNGSLYSKIYEEGLSDMTYDGYIHFINTISPDEVVIISRRILRPYFFLISVVFVGTIAFILLSMFVVLLRMKKFKWKMHLFKTRITWHLMGSLSITLALLTVVSAIFVYQRNEANLHRIMVDRLNAVQNLVQSGIRNSEPVLENVKENTGADVTLFSTQGVAVISTNPQVFDRMLVGTRVNSEAYDQIVFQNKRYCLIKEKFNGRQFYSMYAPVFGNDSRMLAILCTPYVEEAYDFEKDAFVHLMSILSVFFVLLILARLMTSTVLVRLFRPLGDMGLKMSSASLDSLELISYDRDDEISSLVQAYNRMVAELKDSSKKLAQAEREKAWSGMARQVAHEIKNPLTPMKLQIQRLIRLKSKNAPGWEDKLDEVSALLLEHIDILTVAADDFSTLAKLYTQEPVRFNIDKVLQEEIAMHNVSDNIRFDYMGLADTFIVGPKPQLTRVIDNLILNAVQAVGESDGSRIMVSLRNSVKEGYYDIVVEDNGLGVSEENIGKLFTPNFTTKSGGSGLGLAISKSILEGCEATVTYRKSFVLGGACFTITYPKNGTI